MAWCVRRRRTVVVVTFAALAASIASFAFIPKQFFPHVQPAGDPGRPLAAGRLLIRGDRAAGQAPRAAAPERPRSGLRRNLHRRRCAALLSAARPAAQEQNFAQLFLMSKSIEARERVMHACARCWRTISQRALQGRSPVQRSAGRLGRAGARYGPRSQRGPSPRSRSRRRHARDTGGEQRARRLARAGAEPEARHRSGSGPRSRRHLRSIRRSLQAMLSGFQIGEFRDTTRPSR